MFFFLKSEFIFSRSFPAVGLDEDSDFFGGAGLVVSGGRALLLEAPSLIEQSMGLFAMAAIARCDVYS